jgi:cytochrome c oxidase subunit 2
MSRVIIPTAAASFALGCIVGWFAAAGSWFFQARELMDQVNHSDATLQVHCFAKKYSWHFHYTGADGKLGKTDNSLITTHNLIGLDRSDPHSKDDLVTSELVLPCDTTTELITSSADVIHAIGQFHGDMELDATPGIAERITFKTPATPFAGRLRCVQLCGPGFKDHHAPYRYVNLNEFQRWLSQQQPELRRSE